MNNEELVEINGKKYRINDPNIYKCVFTNKWYLKTEFNAGVSTKIRFNGTARDGDRTYYSINLETQPYYEGIPEEELEEYLSHKITLETYSYGPISLNYYGRDLRQVLKEYKIVPGILNPSKYYLDLERPFLDRPLPYRKFNNTFKKVNIEDILGRKVTPEDYKDKEFQRLKSSITKKNIAMGVDSLTHKILEGKRYTMGWEIETVSGRFEEHEVKHLSWAAVHDGSLRGPNRESPQGGEYVSSVMYGDAGFKQLYEMCKLLNKKCTVDKRAGVHLHIGSLNWNKEDLIYSYLLAEMIEEEMFSMLPKSRRTNEYCRKLAPLFLNKVEKITNCISDRSKYNILMEDLYNKLFIEVSNGRPISKSVNSNYDHPQGPKCNWDKTAQRYCWLNYVTLIFNTRNNHNARTLEIRSHGASLNYRKIVNWTKIWVAFCNVVDNHKTSILNGYFNYKGTKIPVNLESMCLITYPNKGQALVDYIRERKEVFKVHGESIDYPVEEHLDKSYKELVLSNNN